MTGEGAGEASTFSDVLDFAWLDPESEDRDVLGVASFALETVGVAVGVAEVCFGSSAFSIIGEAGADGTRDGVADLVA